MFTFFLTLLYVVTAAQFVANLYTALGRGQTLGAAVSAGRKQLHANPQRTIAYDPIHLQDWLVPIVYETAPIRLFAQQTDADGATVTLNLHAASATLQSLPSPDTEFIGRDETLLALDRAFDQHQIVLLQAYAGSGKTMTAAEFARWYSLTGGLDGPVLFTSFERPQPLYQVLDQLGELFEGVLAQNQINWQALDHDGRRQVALAVMAQIPLLWIWDNVEPVAGFPRAQDAELSASQQQELADFLRAARQTQAKFLLTSRRDEAGWLGNLPRRILIPPMPMQERAQLARALADKQGVSFTQVQDWQPLLRFTQGNPLTISSLVGQALRDGLKSGAQIEQFVSDLRQGAAQISDEATQGRAKSLAASLSYGFEHAFDETERQQLALLHFFQGFVDVDVLRWMGDPDDDWSLPILHGVSNDQLQALLNRAVDTGLLTPAGGRNSGTYSIHPALPWFFQALFHTYYPPTPTDPESKVTNSEGVASRAFVQAMGELGNYYWGQYENGNRDIIAVLQLEEANLLHARTLARQQGWFGAIISTMQGLDQLYDHLGRRATWRRLVEEIVPDFVDFSSDGPLPGREEDWSLVTQYRVHLAEEERAWAEAERLQQIRVEWNRRRAAPFLPDPPPQERNTVRTLVISLEQLGHIFREQNNADCIQKYEEAITLCQRIDDKPEEATLAFNLGRAYTDLPDHRDLVQAEQWFRRSLDLYEEHHRHNRAQCIMELGAVAYEQFKEAKAEGQTEAALTHLNTAVSHYDKALELLPANAVNDLAVVHNQLGIIYMNAVDIDRALRHYRESIRYEEKQGNLYGAAQTRFNVAIMLMQNGRLADARDYAAAALRNFEQFGAAATADIEETRELLGQIEADIEESA